MTPSEDHQKTNKSPKDETRGKWKRRFGNAAVFLISISVALLLCELGARLILNPVDYLAPTLVRDDVLGIMLPAGSGGHDQWGFRNSSVPEASEIVAIGDSHTYGNCAKMDEAWPKVLEKLNGKRVYNLGMGGYGPNQYLHLFKTKALNLKPKVVICGLYMGDDFDNAFRITYGLEYWSALRSKSIEGVDPDIWEKEVSPNPSFQKKVRIWLSENSIIYQLVVHGLLGRAKGQYQLKNAGKLYEGSTVLSLPEKNIEEAFMPKGLLRGLDQERQGVREGMRITFDILKEMKSLCGTDARLIVAVIPTKETVFARYVEHNKNIILGETIDQVVANERLARKTLFEVLQREGIEFVDTLPALELASETERIYHYGPADMHPNKNGYRVIAEAIAKTLGK